jgi:hypothetical protein
VDGRQGPGYIGTSSTAQHRIVFTVDFNNTRFDGYMMTQTRNAIAGVTWWNGMNGENYSCKTLTQTLMFR